MSVDVPVVGEDFKTTEAPIIGSPVGDSTTRPLICCWEYAANVIPSIIKMLKIFFMVKKMCDNVNIRKIRRCGCHNITNHVYKNCTYVES